MYHFFEVLVFKPVERTGHPPGTPLPLDGYLLSKFFYFYFFCDSWSFGRRWSRSFLAVKTSSTPPE